MTNRKSLKQSVLSHVAKISVLAAASFAAVACTTHGTKPTGMLAKVEESIAAANSNEAKEYAPLALQKASDHFDNAKREIEDSDYDEATRDLELALAYADFATVKAQAEQKEKAANEVSQGLMDLQRETLK
ncbi:hypothetical protein TDB9533_02539 [Thalassocella blandensis]|nr:hypothetical protein TDB9533_02539 [Thalassocella blandensis]